QLDAMDGKKAFDGILRLVNWSKDYFPGYADQYTFGITGLIRRGLGWDDVVDYQSPAYKAGEWTAFLQGLLSNAPNGIRNFLAQGGGWQGFKRFFWDNRPWTSVTNRWTQWWGRSRGSGPDLGHMIFPKRWSTENGGFIPRGLVNAGFNYRPLSVWI